MTCLYQRGLQHMLWELWDVSWSLANVHIGEISRYVPEFSCTTLQPWSCRLPSYLFCICLFTNRNPKCKTVQLHDHPALVRWPGPCIHNHHRQHHQHRILFKRCSNVYTEDVPKLQYGEEIKYICGWVEGKLLILVYLTLNSRIVETGCEKHFFTKEFLLYSTKCENSGWMYWVEEGIAVAWWVDIVA